MSFITKTIVEEINGVLGVVFSRQMMIGLPLLLLALAAVICFNIFVDPTYHVGDSIWKIRLK